MKTYTILIKTTIFDRVKLVVNGKIVGKVGDRILKINKVLKGKELGIVYKTKFFNIGKYKIPLWRYEDIDWIDITQLEINNMNNKIKELKEIKLKNISDIEEGDVLND